MIRPPRASRRPSSSRSPGSRFSQVSSPVRAVRRSPPAHWDSQSSTPGGWAPPGCSWAQARSSTWPDRLRRQGAQGQELAAAAQGRVQVEGRVLGGGAHQDGLAPLQGRQQDVLLGPVEAVDLVQEQHRGHRRGTGAAPGAPARNFFSSAAEPAGPGELQELVAGGLGQDPGQGGLAGAGRPPEHHGRQPAPGGEPAQGALGPEQVRLAHHLLHGAWGACVRRGGHGDRSWGRRTPHRAQARTQSPLRAPGSGQDRVMDDISTPGAPATPGPRRPALRRWLRANRVPLLFALLMLADAAHARPVVPGRAGFRPVRAGDAGAGQLAAALPQRPALFRKADPVLLADEGLGHRLRAAHRRRGLRQRRRRLGPAAALGPGGDRLPVRLPRLGGPVPARGPGRTGRA